MPAQAKQTGDLAEASVEELMNIEVDTVYGASKHLQKVTEAPASISIVTSDEIRRYGYRTLAEVLRSVRGFYTTYDRNYDYLGVRGFGRPGDYNTRVLLLVDGHRVNDNVYDMAPIGTEFPLDVDLIERVEVIRGPSSSLYGTSAFFGVINVITKHGRDLNGFVASSEVGSFETYKGGLAFGKKSQRGLEMLFSGSFYESEGQQRLYSPEFDSPATNFGITERADRGRSQKLFANLSFQDFNLQSVLSTRKKLIPTGAFETVFNDPRTYTVDTYGHLDLRYEHSFGKNWSVASRLSYNRYQYYGEYMYDYSNDDTPLILPQKDIALGDWWGEELSLSRTLGESHKVTVGSEYRGNIHQYQGNYDLFGVNLDQRQHSQIWAGYVQDEFSLRPNLVFNMGLRYDHYDSFGGTTNPRFGLIYNPLNKTVLKVLYGQAFRAPNSYELYYGEDTVRATANPYLRPETIRTQELVVEQYVGNHVRLSASGFHSHLRGLISQMTDDDGFITFANLESINAAGLELELEGKLVNGLQGRAVYTFQQTEHQLTHEPLSNSPKHLAKFNFKAPLLGGKVFPGLSLQYVGSRRTLIGNNLKGFVLPGFTISTEKLVPKFELSFSVYNLLDKKYSDPGAEEHLQQAIPQDGRNLRFKVSYRF